MGLTATLSLRSRVMLLAGLNLLALAMLAGVATGVRNTQTLRESLLRTAEARVISVSSRLSVEMSTTPKGGPTRP